MFWCSEESVPYLLYVLSNFSEKKEHAKIIKESFELALRYNSGANISVNLEPVEFLVTQKTELPLINEEIIYTGAFNDG